MPIYAFTSVPEVYRRLALWWGVTPILEEFSTDSDVVVRELEGSVLARQLLAPGDHVVVVGALPFRPGEHANSIKVHSISTARR